MLKMPMGVFVIRLGTMGFAMAQERIRIPSYWGEVSAELVDNAATKSLVEMLPLDRRHTRSP